MVVNKTSLPLGPLEEVNAPNPGPQDQPVPTSAGTTTIWDDGADSDTTSGDGHEELPERGVRNMTDAEAAEHI